MNSTIVMKSGEDEYMQGLKETTENTGVHPQKFGLWLAMASMTMFFAALTSALILKKGDFRSWENFKLPNIFLLSTVVIIPERIHACRIDLLQEGKVHCIQVAVLSLGFVLGIVFLLSQWMGFHALAAIGFPLTGNIAGQFVYLVASLHGLHIVVALLITAIVLIFAVRARKDELFELKNIINPKRQLHMELLVTFWHYIDIVWIYLYLFLYFNYR